MRQHFESQNDAWIAAQLGKPVGRPDRKRPFVSFAIIGLASCLSLFGLGSAWGDANESQEKPKKTVIITPKAPRNGDASPELQPESFESYQIRILRNQNQLQAEKIQTLRDELTELTQKLHDAKSHLFAYGDPTDKKKIAELSLELSDKQQTIEKLSSSTYNLQSELNSARKKLFEMETVREALTAMIEQHRIARETAIEALQKQLVALDQTKESEKQALSDQIDEKEKIHAELQQLLSERSETINRLDALASSQDHLLASKQDYINDLQERVNLLAEEIAATTEAYATSNQNHAEHLADIASVLDYEQTEAEQLRDFRDQSHWLADLYDSVHVLYRSQIDQMRQQLDAEEALRENITDLEGQLALHKAEKSILEAANSSHKSLTDDYLLHLSTLIETEETRSLQLESQFLSMASSYDKNRIYAQTLEDLLESANAMLAEQQQQMDLNESDHADVLGTLLQHVDLLEEKQRTTSEQNEALARTLSDLHEEHRNFQSQFAERMLSIENDRLLEKSQFAKHLNEQSAELADREERIAALEQSHEELRNQLERKVGQLSDNLENELISSYHVEVLLQDAGAYLSDLEARLDHQKSIAEQHQLDLQTFSNYHNHNSLELQSQLDNLQQALRDEQSQAEALREELKELQARHYEEKTRYSETIRRSAAMEDQLLAMADEKETAQSQLALATLNLSAALSAIDQIAADKDSFASSQRSFQEESNRYREEIDQLHQGHAELRDERDAAHAQLAIAHQNLNSALAALDQLSAEKSELQQAGQNFNEESNRYREERDTAQAELANAHEKLTAALAALDQLAAEKAHLEQAGQYHQDESNTYRRQLDQLHQEHAAVKEERDAAHSDLDFARQKLNAALTALDKYAAENTELHNAAQQHQDEANQNRNQLDQLQKENSELRNKNEATRSELELEREKLNSVLAELDQLSAEKSDLQSAGQNLENENSRYRNQLDQLQKEHSDLRDERDAVHAELALARQKLNAAAKELDLLAEEKNSLAATARQLDLSGQSSRDDLQELRQQHAALKSEWSHTTKALAETKEELDKAKAALESLKSEKSDLQNAGRDLEASGKAYREQLETLMREIDKERAQHQQNAGALHKSAEEYRQRLEHAIAELNEANQLLSQTRSSHGELSEERKALQEQIQKLTEEITTERKQFFELEQHYNQQIENNMQHTNEAQKKQTMLERLQDRLQQRESELALSQTAQENLEAERARVQELAEELNYTRSLQHQERESMLNLQELVSEMELRNKALESRLQEAQGELKAAHALVTAKNTEASSHAQAYKKIEEAEALYKQALDRSAKTEEQLRSELETERTRFFAIQDELLETQLRLKEIESKFDAAQQYIGEKGSALPKNPTRVRRTQNIKTVK